MFKLEKKIMWMESIFSNTLKHLFDGLCWTKSDGWNIKHLEIKYT